MTFVPTQLSTVFFQAKNSGVVGSQSRVAKKLKLDSLVNLTTLNLRFSNISVIENLDSLVNLTALYLDNNNISVIENLDSLVNLEILGLENNNLTTTEFNKLNTWAILAPSNGKIYTSSNIDNFNLSTTYTTLLGKVWTIFL